MKNPKMLSLLALGSAVTLLAGCGQKDESQPTSPTAPESSLQTPAPPRAPVAPSSAAGPTPPVAPVSSAPDAAQSQIAKIQALIAEGKYTEALAALNELSTMKLSPTQQTLMTELKAQVQKAMLAEAAPQLPKSMGGLPIK